MALKMAFMSLVPIPGHVVLAPGRLIPHVYGHIAQDENNWCWAACAAMLKMGTMMQCDIADAALGRTSCCTSPSPCDVPLKDSKITSLLRTLRFTCSITKASLPFSQVVTQLRKYNVMQVGFTWSKAVSGHVVLLIDAYHYSGVDTVIVLDPEPGAGTAVITYHFLTMAYGLGAWDVSWYDIH